MMIKNMDYIYFCSLPGKKMMMIKDRRFFRVFLVSHPPPPQNLPTRNFISVQKVSFPLGQRLHSLRPESGDRRHSEPPSPRPGCSHSPPHICPPSPICPFMESGGPRVGPDKGGVVLAGSYHGTGRPRDSGAIGYTFLAPHPGKKC